MDSRERGKARFVSEEGLIAVPIDNKATVVQTKNSSALRVQPALHVETVYTRCTVFRELPGKRAQPLVHDRLGRLPSLGQRYCPAHCR